MPWLPALPLWTVSLGGLGFSTARKLRGRQRGGSRETVHHHGAELSGWGCSGVALGLHLLHPTSLWFLLLYFGRIVYWNLRGCQGGTLFSCPVFLRVGSCLFPKCLRAMPA